MDVAAFDEAREEMVDIVPRFRLISIYFVVVYTAIDE